MLTGLTETLRGRLAMLINYGEFTIRMQTLGKQSCLGKPLGQCSKLSLQMCIMDDSLYSADIHRTYLLPDYSVKGHGERRSSPEKDSVL